MTFRRILQGGAVRQWVLALALVQTLFLLSPSLPMGEWRCEDGRLCPTCPYPGDRYVERAGKPDADCAGKRPAFAADCADCCDFVLTESHLRHGSAIAPVTASVLALAPTLPVPPTPAFLAVFLMPPAPVAEPPPSSLPRSPASPRAPPTLA